jgi:uncharacterized protein YbjT (DUF2867 family)
MHNMLNHVRTIREQREFTMMISPDLSAPIVDANDVAATSARLLLDGSWGGIGHVACLGPEDLSPNEMAQIASRVLGDEISYRQISGAELRARLESFGMSAAVAHGLVEMFDAKNQGLDNAEPRTPASTTPTSFADWCQRILAPAFNGEPPSKQTTAAGDAACRR